MTTTPEWTKPELIQLASASGSEAGNDLNDFEGRFPTGNPNFGIYSPSGVVP